MKELPRLYNRADILGIIDPSNSSVQIDQERKLQVQDIFGRSTEKDIIVMIDHVIANRTTGRFMWVVSLALAPDDAERILRLIAVAAAQKAIDEGLQVQADEISRLNVEFNLLEREVAKRDATIEDMDGQLQRLRGRVQELKDENNALKAMVQKAEQLKRALKSFLD